MRYYGISRIKNSEMTVNERHSKEIAAHAPGRKLAEGFGALLRWILGYANHGRSKLDLFREVTKVLADFSGCDSIELHIMQDERYYLCEASPKGMPFIRCESLPSGRKQASDHVSSDIQSALEQLRLAISRGDIDSSSPFVTTNGSFCIGDTNKSFELRLGSGVERPSQPFYIGGVFRSLALIPFDVDNDRGILQLQSKRLNYFSKNEIESYEAIAQTLGIVVANWQAHAASQERVKELACLYDMAQIVHQPGISLVEMLQGIVEILPPAWQYPDQACARIVFDGHFYATRSFREGPQKLAANIIVSGKPRGFVEVVYPSEKLAHQEGLFLKEERSLINAVARQVALVIERRQVEEERANLEEQLRHAERLVTIGQLAAGVAHELNEPLANILGFAQLANKFPELPPQVSQDIEKIISASLHAREIIKKLMLFARQTSPERTSVNMNEVIEEGLYFFEARCAKGGIKIVRSLAHDLPEVVADRTQLSQVLINLVVNAIQAMPQGGTLSIITQTYENMVSFVVEDNGIGMSDEVRKQIFVPFFTTKGVGKGTGLGLPVVHGIVTSHGGSINVESWAGIGTRVEVRFPMEAVL